MIRSTFAAIPSQNNFFFTFFLKKFAYIKKKQYLCTRFRNSSNHNT